jgi:hypothetical protein
MMDSDRSAPPAAVEAQRLRGLWAGLQRNHVPMVMGCSCGGPVNHVSLGDIERDILDYLEDKYGHPETMGVRRRLRVWAGLEGGGKGSLAALLNAMTALGDESEDKDARALLLADLGRSIASLAPLARAGN